MVAMVSIKAKSLQAVLAGVFGRCLQQLHHFSLEFVMSYRMAMLR